jgi:hypothetical protein
VARPSTKAPARAELMYAFMFISYQWGDLRRSSQNTIVRFVGSSVGDPSHAFVTAVITEGAARITSFRQIITPR